MEKLQEDIDASELRDATEEIDLLTKSRLCDTVRAKSHDERTDEERKWIALDKILNPGVYEEPPEVDPFADDPHHGPPQPKPTPMGDVYEHQRVQYEAGMSPDRLEPALEEAWFIPHDEHIPKRVSTQTSVPV